MEGARLGHPGLVELLRNAVHPALGRPDLQHDHLVAGGAGLPGGAGGLAQAGPADLHHGLAVRGRHVGRRAHLVFVTAYDKYAVQAFAEGALDYLVKPIYAERLKNTVARLQQRLREAQPAMPTEALLQQLAAHLERRSTTTPLRWIRASIGTAVRLIATQNIDFLRAEDKYTLIAWRGDADELYESVIRTPLKELSVQLDPAQFVQVHRSAVVNLNAIAQIVRGANETADIHLKGRSEVLPVSRSYLHLFRQM